MMLEKRYSSHFLQQNERGNGLGLSIVYSIIKDIDGYIDVTSQPNIGTEFEIKLPQKGCGLDLGNISYMTENKVSYDILVIDDQKPVAEAVAEMLKALGHNAEFVVDDKKALDYILNKEYHAVMCDLAMPNCTGAELAGRIKSLKNIPVILMTGWLGNLNESDREFIDEIIQKPFAVEELREIINKVCIN